MTIPQNDISREIANFADMIERRKGEVDKQHQQKLVGLAHDLRETAKVLCCCGKCRPMHGDCDCK